MKEEYIEIGQIVNTHGIKGTLKIVPFTDDVKRFEDLKFIYVDVKGHLEKYSIINVKYGKNDIVLLDLRRNHFYRISRKIKRLLYKNR